MLWNILSIMWQIPLGFQIASCALIGQQIGARNLQSAYQRQKYIFSMGMTLGACLLTMYILLRNHLVQIFTRDTELIRLANESIIFVLILHSLDFTQTILFGSIKALAL